jgi:hypothetical protein
MMLMLDGASEAVARTAMTVAWSTMAIFRYIVGNNSAGRCVLSFARVGCGHNQAQEKKLNIFMSMSSAHLYSWSFHAK